MLGHGQRDQRDEDDGGDHPGDGPAGGSVFGDDFLALLPVFGIGIVRVLACGVRVF